MIIDITPSYHSYVEPLEVEHDSEIMLINFLPVILILHFCSM